MTSSRHLIGLLLGTEEDWPRAFEEILRRLGPVAGTGGTRHVFDCERITIEPFDLRDRPRYELVIDRLAYWYYHPREWLKKVALPAFPRYERLALRLIGVRQFVWLRSAPAAGPRRAS